MTQQEQAPEGRRPAAENSFRRGFLDGVPIGLGYFSVSIAFGILCAVNGMDIRATVLISMTNLTSAGQLAGAGVIFGGGTLLEMALTQLVINLRYALMSISLSQKLHKSVRFADRLWVSFFITDEIFAVSASKPGEVGRRYFMGVAIVPYLGWALGTLAGGCGRRAAAPKCAKRHGRGAVWHVCGHCGARGQGAPPRAGRGGAGGCV